MKFVRKKINKNKYIDNVFTVSSAAKNDPSGINASIGCLYGEDNKIYTFNSVFGNEKNISNENNVSYANPSGNKEFLDAIGDFVLDKHIKNNYRILASSGGTGAIYMGIRTCLDEKDTIILPEIGWGNYGVIAQELNLNVLNYDIYNINSLLSLIDNATDKIFIVINSPCHNPCGHSYSFDEWKAIIDKANNCGKEVIILNDIAYIDYSFEDRKQYFDLFNDINDNVLVLIAYSCSKAFSYYGKRVGALIAINNDNEFLDTYINYCTRIARTTWSNVNNGAMQNIVDVLNNHRDEYLKEKQELVNLLKNRSSLFISQAKENNLEIYPYTDGFFITLIIEEQNRRDSIHENLLKNHIYAVKIKKGIRIGICALPLNVIDGLAKKIKDLY